MTMYDNSNTFEKTFDWGGLPEYLKQAQWAELIELKKIITSLSIALSRPITILDIGVGDGRVLKHLQPIHEVWSNIEKYHAIDNTEQCVQSTQAVIENLHISEQVTVEQLDAIDLPNTVTYDLIITTWFTAGNFHPDSFDFETYSTGQRPLDLSANTKFTKIFTQCYELLNPGGRLVFGSVYKDNEETRLKQESFYKYFGMNVITGEKDSFTATKEGFWSQRFTPQKFKSYLSTIPPQAFNFVDLDTYDFAMLVDIGRRS